MAQKPKNQVARVNYMELQEQLDANVRFRTAAKNLAVPMLFIVQATSSFGADTKRHLGEIYNSHFRTFSQSVEVAFFSAPSESRVLYTETFIRGAPKVCASPDGVKPYSQYVGREVFRESIFETANIPDNCAACPLREAGCNQRLVYAGVMVENSYPFIQISERTKLDAAKRLNLDLEMGAMFGDETTWILSSEEQERNGNVYYVPVWTRGKPITSYQGLSEMIQRMGSLLEKTEPVYDVVMPEPDNFAHEDEVITGGKNEIPF